MAPDGEQVEGKARRERGLGARTQNARHPSPRDPAPNGRMTLSENCDVWLQTRLVDAIGQAVIATDLAGLVTYWNRAAEELYGWSFREAVGRPVSELIVATTSADQAERIAVDLASGGSWTGEFLVRSRDGRAFPVLVTGTPILDAANELVGMVGISTDLSARKAAEAALAELAAVVDASEDAIISVSPEGEIRTWNAGAERLYGYSAAEVIGRPQPCLGLDELASESALISEKCLGGGTIRQSRTTCLRKDGSRVDVAFSASPILASDGAVIGITFVARDLTSEVAAEQALTNSENRFRRIFTESPVGKALMGRDSRIIDVNASFATMLGYDRADLVGKTVADVSHPDDVPVSEELLASLSRGEIDSYQVDKRYVRADGSFMWGRLTATAFRDEKGEVEFRLGFIEDITEQLEAQQRLAEGESCLRMALESASMWTFDNDLIAGQVTRTAGWVAAERFGLSEVGPAAEFVKLIHPDDRRLSSAAGVDTADDADTFLNQFRIRSTSGEYRWVETRGRVTRDEAGRQVRVTGTGMDITREKLAEGRQAEVEQTLRRTLNASMDSFIEFDAHGVITEWNPAAERTLGWSRGEACGNLITDLLLPRDERDRFDELVQRAAQMMPGEAVTFRPSESFARHRDGHLVPMEVTCVCVQTKDGVRCSAFARDISERRALYAQLERQALTDVLTGLPNRVLLHDRLGGAMRRLARRPGLVGILFLDLDRFKVLNDSLGHAAGDELLQSLGRRLSAMLRAGDTVSRFGGDEYVIMPEEVRDIGELTTLAERILASFSEPVRVGGFDVTPSASIGIACTSDAGCTPGSLLRDADLAMYRAKARGGGNYEIFDGQMREGAMARLEREAELRRAIASDELRVHYQPYVARDGGIAGVEALVRWDHPERGLVLPADFIPLAEETGLIAPLGAWVLREACSQVAAWRAADTPDLELSVNLSVRQLADTDLSTIVADTLAETGLDPWALCLEITETALMRDPAAAGASLKQIRNLGVRIAVDDFGTGYGSLLYTRRFPVQVLKLDRFFVSGLGRVPEDTIIAQSVIDLAHSLGLVSFAEGVETKEQFDALRELGCDFLQGYYWSPPIEADAVADLLRRDQALGLAQRPADDMDGPVRRVQPALNGHGPGAAHESASVDRADGSTA